MKLLDKNAADLEKIFCDPGTLGHYMTLPAFSKLTIQEVSTHLCKPSIMAAVINAIDVTKTLEQVFKLY